MFKIAWKSFKHNIKSFIVFFLSAVFSVAMIFGFMYLGELTKEIKVAGLDSDAGYILGQTLVAVLVVSICIMLYSVKFYVRTRSRDYTMLLILGIRKKHFILFVALEYIFSWIVSIVIGLGAGNLIVLGFRKILEQIGGDAITYSVVDVQKIYAKVLGWCVVLIIGVVLVLIGYMAERDLSYLLQADIKKERPKVHKIWGLLALGGIVLVIIAVILSFFTLEGDDSCMGMLVTGVIGVYFSLQFGLGIVFERYKERHEDKYYRNALKWNSFYCRLTDNINIVAAQV